MSNFTAGPLTPSALNAAFDAAATYEPDGGVARPIADKLAETVSLGDFAPPSNPSTDARAALAAANAKAATDGRGLRISPGTFRVASDITFTAREVTFDPGASLVPDSGVTVRYSGMRSEGYLPYYRPSRRERDNLGRWELGPTENIGTVEAPIMRPTGLYATSADVDLYGETAGTFTGRDRNALVGVAVGYSPNLFPSGVTGAGMLRFAGGTAFGLHGRAYQYTAGCATNEDNAFNMAGLPDTALPPNRGFGTNTNAAIVVTVAPGGNYPCAALMHFCKEGSLLGNSSWHGLIFNSDVVQGGYVFNVLATASMGAAGVFNLRYPASSGLVLFAQAMGTGVAGRGIMTFANSGGGTEIELRQGGEVYAAKLRLWQVPTSASGLTSGQVWSDGGTLKIVA